MTYSASTYRSGNPLRRFAHNSRFIKSAKLVAEHCSHGASVLDYGAGDGHFLDVLRERGFRATGYDPLPIIRRGDVISSLNGVTQKFDCITCLETLEHVTDQQIDSFISDVRRLLNPAGVVVISVPVMSGPVVLLKATATVYRGKHQDCGYTWRNLLVSACGAPPVARWINEDGIYNHMGFDHRRLHRKLLDAFAQVSKQTSPFTWLPDGLNSQVFFSCRV